MFGALCVKLHALILLFVVGNLTCLLGAWGRTASNIAYLRVPEEGIAIPHPSLIVGHWGALFVKLIALLA